MKKLLFVFLAFLSAGILYAENMSTSTYLLTGSYPASAAKGAACGASSGGALASDLNPALIASADYFSYSAMHAVLPGMMALERLTVAKSFDFGAIGADISYYNFGDTRRVGLDINLGPVFTSDVISSRAFAGAVTYGKKFENISFGIALKYIVENIGESQWSMPAADAGIIFEGLGAENMDAGISVLNLSAEDADYALPLTIKGALTYNFRSRVAENMKLTAGADYLVRDNALKAGAGFDYFVTEEITLRGGVTAGQNQPIRFTAGFGAKALGVSLDYAYVPDAAIGDTHKVSVSGSFGKPDEDVEKPAGKAGESYEGYKKSGDYYYENKQYRQALKYYEYLNLLYWKEIEDMPEREKSSFFQKLGICYYNIRDNKRALQYFDRAVYFEKDNEILKHWIKLLK